MNTPNTPSGFLWTLPQLAGQLSSPKTPEDLWGAVMDEWWELQEIATKIQATKSAVEKQRLIPYYLDELADVYWNLAKWVTFSQIEAIPEQENFIQDVNQMKTYWGDIVARATRKFSQRYETIKKGKDTDERDSLWEEIKQKQRIDLQKESVRYATRILLRLDAGRKQGTLFPLRDFPYMKLDERILVNKWLKDWVINVLMWITNMWEKEVEAVFSRTDMGVISVWSRNILIELVKWPEGIQASMSLNENLPTIFVWGTDVARKMADSGIDLRRQKTYDWRPFWWTSELLCLTNMTSVQRILEGGLPDTLLTRWAPLITNEALYVSKISARVITTDSNVEGKLLSASKDSTIIGNEVVQTGASVVANTTPILYWDGEKISVYGPCERQNDGSWPSESVIWIITQQENPALCSFVQSLQTPLDVCVWSLNESQADVRIFLEKTLETISSSKYQ